VADEHGEDETQIWSGPLYPADQVLEFLNAAHRELEMRTTLEEIFVHSGPHGSAPQSKDSWDLYDLWGGRMAESLAEGFLMGRERERRAKGVV
jgi:alpha-galactosidase